METHDQELVRKVEALVRSRFYGNFRSAFRHYDRLRTTDGQIDRDELENFLEDAGVGNRMTRSAWTRAAMDKLDTDRDGRISWQEFEPVMTKR